MQFDCCDLKPVTKWWGYVLVIVIFAVLLLLWTGLIFAEKRVFPDTVKMYTLPTTEVQERPLRRRVVV